MMMGRPLATDLVTELLAKLHAAFPSAQRAKDSEQTITVYREGLGGMTEDAVRFAVHIAIMEDEFFPKVARLRDLAHRHMNTRHMQNMAASAMDPLFCRGCGQSARWEARWRPQLDARGRHITDGQGRIALETFQRYQCDCSAPSQWQADAHDDPWMTQNIPVDSPSPSR